MHNDVKELLDDGPLFDNAIVAHAFTPYLRDYDVIVDVTAAVPGEQRSYIEGRYRYRFSHCVEAHTIATVADHVWQESWDDVYIDYTAWERAGAPDGYVWGVEWALAYPGLTYIEDSATAQEWSVRLGNPMHEVKIETNVYTLQIIFHNVRVDKIAQGNPDDKELVPLKAENEQDNG